MIIDEASLTGEADPIKKTPEDPWVRSGTQVGRPHWFIQLFHTCNEPSDETFVGGHSLEWKSVIRQARRGAFEEALETVTCWSQSDFANPHATL